MDPKQMSAWLASVITGLAKQRFLQSLRRLDSEGEGLGLACVLLILLCLFRYSLAASRKRACVDFILFHWLNFSQCLLCDKGGPYPCFFLGVPELAGCSVFSQSLQEKQMAGNKVQCLFAFWKPDSVLPVQNQ